MNTNQKYTPKYWVVHNPKTEDVYIDTLDKSLTGSCDKFLELYPGIRSGLFDGSFKCELIELQLVPKVK